MRTLVCLLEELSAEAMLRGILPRLLPEDCDLVFIPFEGKQDLERQLARKIRLWKKPDTWFLVLRDQDAGDCVLVKQRLQMIVKETGKEERVLVRVACHELESFYLGDLRAVEEGLGLSGLAHRQEQKLYRTPDALSNASQELKILTKKRYQKVSGSKKIAPYLSVDGSNRSGSFNALLRGIRRILPAAPILQADPPDVERGDR